MIVPSIDLMSGQAVQLIGGKEKALDAGDPRKIAERFSLVGEIAVIDLDAALGKGSNSDVIRELCHDFPCRVGGGIRDLETAKSWLDAGAEKIILGTRAIPEILSQLPRERVHAALDAHHGEVVVKGWTEGTGQSILDRMRELRPFVSGFLVTFVEREGRMQGTNMELVEELVKAAGEASVTIAGGVTTSEDIRRLDELGADAQVGMALYTGKLSLADGLLAPMKCDRADGLWPTVVTDEHGVALGLTWSNRESVTAAIETRCGVYHSRKRGLWVKGESSGNRQTLRKISLDCDRDALRFIVSQNGEGFCHQKTYSCWGNTRFIGDLTRTLASRMRSPPDGSYTRRLLDDPELLKSKIREEARELCDAGSKEEVIAETADVIYFALVRLIGQGATWEDVERELARRSMKISRRPGNRKD